MKILLAAGALLLGLSSAMAALDSSAVLRTGVLEAIPDLSTQAALSDADVLELNQTIGALNIQPGRASQAGPAGLGGAVRSDAREGNVKYFVSEDVGMLGEMSSSASGGRAFEFVGSNEPMLPRHRQVMLLAQAPEAESPAPTFPPAPGAPAAPEAPEAAYRAGQAAQAQAAQARAAAQVDRARSELSGRKAGLQAMVNRFGSGPDGRSLVVRTSNTDPKSISAVQEDMNVMSHILEKAAEKREGEDDRRAMGVRLSLFGDGLKNMQIEGYGVIFLVKVNFPLSGPPEKVAENKGEQGTNSTWEEAKRELYGPAKGLPGGGFGGGYQAVPGASPAEPYNPKRVEELKESLVDALKNASNIRGLKEDDNVTVVVTGGGPSDFVYRKFVVQSNFSTDPTSVTQDEESKGSPGPKSTLTIKARKGDIDAVAKGKMDVDAFKKKVAIAMY
jgi:hypothetical protein